jgi:hypothetical protein
MTIGLTLCPRAFHYDQMYSTDSRARSLLPLRYSKRTVVFLIFPMVPPRMQILFLIDAAPWFTYSRD